MAKSSSTDYCGSVSDGDSGVGIDLDYASSNDFNSSSTLTLIKSSPSYISQSRISPPLPSFPPPPSPPPMTTTTTGIKRQFDVTPLIKFASDGVVERIRPATMKNSENGDFVLCRTDRGSFVAYRTPVVPQWVTRLVQEIEFKQQ